MGFRSLFARWGMLALVAGLSACSPQILGEKLSEQCDLKGFSYSSASITVIKLRESLNTVPAFIEGIPESFEITPALPAGVSLDPATGIISGVPTAASTQRIYTVRARSPSGCGVTRTLSLRVTGTDPVQSTLGVNRTQVAVGTSPDTTVTVTFLDSKGQPVVGNQVSLVSDRAQDVVSATSGSVTDSNGVATFTLHSTLSGIAHLTAVDVTDLETLSAQGLLELTPGPATQVTLADLTSTLVAGTPVTVEIRAADAYGNRVLTVEDPVRVSHDDPSSSALGAGPTTLTLAEGKAQFAFKLTRAGTTTLSVQHLPAGGPALTPQSNAVTVIPGAIDLSKTVILPPTTTLTAGDDELFLIEPRDSFGNANPSNTASVSEVVLNTSSGASGSVHLGTLTYNSTNKQFEIPVTGWTKGTLSLIPTLRGVNGVATALTVNPGSVHHVDLAGLPETIDAGTPIPDLLLHAFDIAENRVNPGALSIRTFIDPHCKVPTTGHSSRNTNLPTPVFDTDTEHSIYSPLELYNAEIRYLGISAVVNYCSPPLTVHPGPASNSNSILTFDYFPFTSTLAARSKTFPSDVQASVRAVILDQYRNPIPRWEVKFLKSRDLRTASFVYRDPNSGIWGADSPDTDEITLTTDHEGVIHFGLDAGNQNVELGVRASVDRNFSWIDQELSADFQTSLVLANLYPGNLADAGMVTVTGREPSPIVPPEDTPAPPNDHPKWIVAIHANPDSGPKTILCPGVLVSLSQVLTPASCLVKKASGLAAPLAVQAGSFWDPSVSTMYRQTRSVRRVTLDPIYTATFPISDLAAVEVDPPFTTNSMIESKTFRTGGGYVEEVRGYSWLATSEWDPYGPDTVAEGSSYLRYSNQFEIKETLTLNGIPDGSGSTFSMLYQTLGIPHGTNQDLITLGQYTVLSDKNLGFLGFVVRTGDEANPPTRGRTLDTSILIDRNHPYVIGAFAP